MAFLLLVTAPGRKCLRTPLEEAGPVPDPVVPTLPRLPRMFGDAALVFRVMQCRKCDAGSQEGGLRVRRRKGVGRECGCQLADAALEVHQLRTRGNPRQRLVGWPHGPSRRDSDRSSLVLIESCCRRPHIPRRRRDRHAEVVQRAGGVVRERLRADPMSRHLFFFCNRDRNRMKVLVADESGMWVLRKRHDPLNQAARARIVAALPRRATWLFASLTFAQDRSREARSPTAAHHHERTFRTPSPALDSC
jgi:hypothetical protein